MKEVCAMPQQQYVQVAVLNLGGQERGSHLRFCAKCVDPAVFSLDDTVWGSRRQTLIKDTVVFVAKKHTIDKLAPRVHHCVRVLHAEVKAIKGSV